jgi:hypothetical protein
VVPVVSEGKGQGRRMKDALGENGIHHWLMGLSDHGGVALAREDEGVGDRSGSYL